MGLDVTLDEFELTGFDASEVAAIVAGSATQKITHAKARAIATQTRLQMRRAKSEAVLAAVLPATLEPDTSYHVISAGDVDALSYLRHVIKQTPLDYCAISSWCLARPDIEEVAAWLEAGRVTVVDWYLGEIFPNQYGDEHEMLRRVIARHGGRLVIARNHSKVTLGAHVASHFYVAIASSANVNTNPRIEQTTLTTSEDLFYFYRDFYDGLKSIERNGATLPG